METDGGVARSRTAALHSTAQPRTMLMLCCLCSQAALLPQPPVQCAFSTTHITRRSATLVPFLALSTPCPASAVSPSSSLVPLLRAKESLVDCERLVQAREWTRASQLAESSLLDSAVLTKAFDGYTDKPSAQETAMNNAAFIVYYEERRYGDIRLEPKEPSRRAMQNGFKREALSSIDDLRSELRFFAKEFSAGRDVDDDSELRQYIASAESAVAGYLALAKPDDLSVASTQLAK